MSDYRNLLIAIAAANGHPEPSQYADAVEEILANGGVATPAAEAELTQAPAEEPVPATGE